MFFTNVLRPTYLEELAEADEFSLVRLVAALCKGVLVAATPAAPSASAPRLLVLEVFIAYTAADSTIAVAARAAYFWLTPEPFISSPRPPLLLTYTTPRHLRPPNTAPQVRQVQEVFADFFSFNDDLFSFEEPTRYTVNDREMCVRSIIFYVLLHLLWHSAGFLL